MKRAVVLLVAVLAASGAQAKPSLSPFLVRTQVGADQKLGARVPAGLKLRDHSGRVVTLGSRLGNKPVIITPVYYSCPILCNVVLDQLNNRLAELRFTVGKEFDVLTYSFDPKETAADAYNKRRIYVGRYGRVASDDAWPFMTGDGPTVQKLSEALGFSYLWDPKQKQFAHAAAVIVVTPDGRISRYFRGVEYTARDLRFALVEASEGKIGSTVDRLMLLCYEYDPASGKYGVTAMNLVRAGGAATVFGLAGFIFVMLRRERNAAKK